MTTSVRPGVVLRDWLDKYGYARNRSTALDRPTLCYALVGAGPDGDASWRFMSSGDEGKAVLVSAWEELITAYKGDTFPGRDLAPRVDAILLVTHGEACLTLGTDETGPIDHTELPAELLEALEAENPVHYARVMAGRVPTRSVNVITREGLACDVTLHYAHETDPFVETLEQWTEDENATVPVARGVVDESLMTAFGYAAVLFDLAQHDVEMSVPGLVKAMNEDKLPRQLIPFILRLLAHGIEKFGNDDDDDETDD